MSNISGNVYAGELANLWAERFSSTEGDVVFFSRVIAEYGEPALELGSGAGRLLIPLCQAGFDVDGLEPSAELYIESKNRLASQGLKAAVCNQSMADLKSITRKYRVVFASRGVLQLLVSHEEISRSLEAIRHALLPRGYVAVEFVGFNKQNDSQPTDWLPLHGSPSPAVQKVKNYVWRRVSVSGGIETAEVAIADCEVTKIAEMRTKIYDPDSARTTFEHHGFEVKFIGSWDGYCPNSCSGGDFILIGCRKP